MWLTLLYGSIEHNLLISYGLSNTFTLSYHVDSEQFNILLAIKTLPNRKKYIQIYILVAAIVYNLNHSSAMLTGSSALGVIFNLLKLKSITK